MRDSKDVFLSSTDTTIGFLSQDKEALNRVKKRPRDKEYIVALDSFKALTKRVRVPLKFRKKIRRAKRATFIYPNKIAFRVVDDKNHLLLLKRLEWAYTTSANLTGSSYNREFATTKADIIVEPLIDRYPPSNIYKINRSKIKKIR